MREVTGDKTYTDTNYVFPTFILSYMPIGLMGLMIAAILSAAMSASSGELNALATATAIDFYRRHINPTAPDAAFLRFSKIATAFWGLFACVAAYYSANLGSLIDTVNKIGSLFYGSILGVFILALGVKRGQRARRVLRAHRGPRRACSSCRSIRRRRRSRTSGTTSSAPSSCVGVGTRDQSRDAIARTGARAASADTVM